jgi:D-alanine-D-alanine ligase
MKIKVGVLFGGKTVEHEISIISAIQAIGYLDRNKYDVIPIYITKNNEFYIGEKIGDIKSYTDINSLLKESQRVIMLNEDGKVKLIRYPMKKFGKNELDYIDIAFPVVHGTNVEDGTLQGYLQMFNIPYVGCDVLSSAVGMDKYVMKVMLKEAGVSVLPGFCFNVKDYIRDADEILSGIELEIGYPVIIKPVNLGSSVGITKVNSEEELDSAIMLALSFADRVLVEKAITDLREINCSVVGDAVNCEASVCEEPIANDEILSYEDKYMGNSKNSGGSKGMASLGRKIPAELSEDKTQEIRDLACKVFKALGCNGVVRIDFMIDTKTDTVYANEINTIPGSLAFYLWEATGVKYTDLIDRLIDLAFKRNRLRDNITYTIDTNILAGVSFGGAKGSKGAKM